MTDYIRISISFACSCNVAKKLEVYMSMEKAFDYLIKGLKQIGDAIIG